MTESASRVGRFIIPLSIVVHRSIPANMCLGGYINSVRTIPRGFVEISCFHQRIKFNVDPNQGPYPSK